MLIKSDTNLANEKSSNIKNSSANFTEFTVKRISGGNIDNIDKVNEMINQMKSILSTYDAVAKRDSENIELIAETFDKVDSNLSENMNGN